MKIFEIIDHRNNKRIWRGARGRAETAAKAIARAYYTEDTTAWVNRGSIPTDKPFYADYMLGRVHFPTIQVHEVVIPKRDFLALLNAVATELPDLDGMVERTKREEAAA